MRNGFQDWGLAASILRRQAGFDPAALPGLIQLLEPGSAVMHQDADGLLPAGSGDPVRLAEGMSAPSDAGRPVYRTGGIGHLLFDGADDTLRRDAAVAGPVTLWMAGDFSMLGTDRWLSLGGDLGADWNRAGYIAFEDDAGGYLKLVRDNVAHQATTGYPPYILLEIDADGHRSYGPLGVDSAVAAPATNAGRIALGASANASPTAYGSLRLSSFGLVQGLLPAALRQDLTSYLTALSAPAA